MKLQDLTLLEIGPNSQRGGSVMPKGDRKGNISGEANIKPMNALRKRNLSLKIFRRVFKNDIVNSKEIGAIKSYKITNTILANLNNVIAKTEHLNAEDRENEIKKVITQMQTFVKDSKKGGGLFKFSSVSPQEIQMITNAYKSEENDIELLKMHLRVLKDIKTERQKGNK